MFDTIFNFISGILPALVWMIVRTLGIGFVTYSGVDFVADQFSGYLFSVLSGMPENILMIMSRAGVDVAIKMIIAAYVASFSTLLSLGQLKRMIFTQ
jgi:hypothetical protein